MKQSSHAAALSDAEKFRPADFVARLPIAATQDSEFRFAGKLATQQRVAITVMQSEPEKSDPAKLGQARLTMQLRGAYPDIKLLVAGMLDRFPGLTLQHLTLRHHDAVGGEMLTEATVQFLQYFRPMQ